MTDSPVETPDQPKRSSRRRLPPTPEQPTAEAPEPPASLQSAAPPDAGVPPPFAAPAAPLLPPPPPPPQVSVLPPPPPPPSPSFSQPPIMLQEPTPMPPANHPGAALGPPPTPEPLIGHGPFRRHDVVQIMDPDSRHLGGFLIVGDVLGDKVHGYYYTEGRQKQFLTVALRFCWHMGTSRIRAQYNCSPKWISDYRPQPSQ